MMDSRLQPLASSVTAHAAVQAQSPARFGTCARPTLDGVTLMRYAHIYRSQMAGGMEHYLRPLDRALLTRAQDVLNEEREFVVRDFSMAALIERHEQFYDELRRQSPPKQLPASSRRQSSEY